MDFIDMKKIIFSISVVSLLLLLACGTSFFIFIWLPVAQEVDSLRQKGAIDSIIFSESPVYYDDGKSVIGVFFDRTHRKYIYSQDIPDLFIKALIAAEDKNFFQHPGFDMKAMIRAFISNMRAGKTVQGGSTITQQTAKNIFTRQKRSYKAKLKELIQALLLERRYKKEEILEMYVNQFFVTGLGRGLGIAAQYFFDKDAKALDLVESAFIAGSIKAPNRYNPFTKKTEAARKEAIRLAEQRKDYVLEGMLSMDVITKEQYLEAKRKDIPFREGKVTYRLNVILDYIRSQLQTEYFNNILMEQGIENIATSGIRIFTSINREIQEAAFRSLRKHLTLLDVKLSGIGGKSLSIQEDSKENTLLKEGGPEAPLLCRITHINPDLANPYITVSWDDGEGMIDLKGLQPVGEAWLKGRQGPWAVFEKRHVLDFLKNFKVGDFVHAELMEPREINDQRRFMLSKIPELQGGIVVLRKGMVKAMAGGFSNYYFNRAVDAKRQLGSIFKPMVYAASLQLKWNTLDSLINKRGTFHFENTTYLPRPDHEPESDIVSMIWAGAKSENLATVWLLYHLTDHLDTSEFRQVVELLGLARRTDESYENYVRRVRDGYGIQVSEGTIEEVAFEESKKEILPDLIFGEEERLVEVFEHLPYRWDENTPYSEREGRPSIRTDYRGLQSLNREMKHRFEGLMDLGNRRLKSIDIKDADIHADLFDFYLSENEGSSGRLVFSKSPHQRLWSQLRLLTPEWLSQNLDKITMDDVWIDGVIPSGILDEIQSRMERHYRRLSKQKLYDPEILFKNRDFRTMVNLRYVTNLSERMGISTKLDPVLSFPLGANSISILEAALTYHTIMTGKLCLLGDSSQASMVPLITRIEDRDGETIWEYAPVEKDILSKRASGLLREILRMVIERGTGQSAKNAVQLFMDVDGQNVDISIPAFGKTGTSNNHTNSSFVGFIPGPKSPSGQLNLDDGYVVASYVGYDDNRPMKGRRIVVYGSSGALPIWIDAVNSIVNGSEFKENIRPADLIFDTHRVPALDPAGAIPVLLSPRDGLARGAYTPGTHLKEDSPWTWADAQSGEGMLKLNREFEPFAFR